jgi:hypothetical protein
MYMYVSQVWGILASVLHISSLEFTIEDTAEGDIVHLDPVVQQVCRHSIPLYRSRTCTEAHTCNSSTVW